MLGSSSRVHQVLTGDAGNLERFSEVKEMAVLVDVVVGKLSVVASTTFVHVFPGGLENGVEFVQMCGESPFELCG